jgi:hypothetical protein
LSQFSRCENEYFGKTKIRLKMGFPMVLQTDWVGVMEVGCFVLWVGGVCIAITALSRVFLLNSYWKN